MHGLYLTRRCDDLETLAHELLGLHSWFSRNVPFSALIRGADIHGWKTRLTKTWLYRGTLHGVTPEDLPELLAISAKGEQSGYFAWLAKRAYKVDDLRDIADEVVRLMEDGVYSRTEFRRIFAGRYDQRTIDHVFSPWGGIFTYLAQVGKVAFRDMGSRDFDLISAEPTQTFAEVLPDLIHRYFTAYGPATLSDAAWFFGISKEDTQKLRELPLDDLQNFAHGGKTYYCGNDDNSIGEIPEMTLLSGFDPIISSYTIDDRLIIPQEHKSRLVLKSGICLPSIAINGSVAGIWNIKKNEPTIEFFAPQPKRMQSAAYELVESMRCICIG